MGQGGGWGPSFGPASEHPSSTWRIGERTHFGSGRPHTATGSVFTTTTLKDSDLSPDFKGEESEAQRE